MSQKKGKVPAHIQPKQFQHNLLEDMKLLFVKADAVQFKGVDAAHTLA